MNIGFHNPYIDSFGGGERYTLTLACHWSRTHTVSVFWDTPSDIAKAGDRFGLDVSRITCVPDIFTHGSLPEKLRVTRTFNCMFFLSDGSVPLSFAKVNLLHFQVPFARVSMPFWKSVMYKRIVCNSEFTSKHLDPALSVRRITIYPPVDTAIRPIPEKNNIILTVGRMGGSYNAKKHDLLIDAYRRMYTEYGIKNWKLIVAGSLHASDADAFRALKKKAAGLPIEFFPDCPYDKLLSLYDKSSIYWHAAGYGESDPVRMEHFGITTVEAMNAGCIPVVFDGGGQPEIIRDGINGYLWNNSLELLEKTLAIIEDGTQQSLIRSEAAAKAKQFSDRKFTDSFDSLLSAVT